MNWKAIACLVACSALLLPAAQAQDKFTERTLKQAPGAKPVPATLDAMKWLRGRWVGEAFGGTTEEIWSGPDAGAMVGLFRLVKDGKPVFYELMTIVEVDGTLAFRLKHFNPDLKGWEEREEVQEFPLVAMRDRVIDFEGMSFHRDGDRATIYLAIEAADGTVSEQTFTYRRATDQACMGCPAPTGGADQGKGTSAGQEPEQGPRPDKPGQSTTGPEQ